MQRRDHLRLSSGSSTLDLHVRTVTVPSGDLAFVDEGEGPPILLIHGAPLAGLGFVRVVHGLRLRHHVVVPDLPGFGGSRPSARFDGSLAAYASSIGELCQALDLRDVVLFGCDAGACVALAAAVQMPARLRGVVVADTVPIPLTGRAALVRFFLRWVVTSRPARLLNRRLNLLPWLVSTVDPLRRPFTADERRVFRGQFDTVAKRDRILALFSEMARDDAFMRDLAADVRRHLADVPALLIYGQFDPMRLAGAVSRYRSLLPRAVVRIVRGEKHFPILAAGNEVAAILDAWMSTIAHVPVQRPVCR
jgi:haloalkane dehalogenase